MSAPRVQRSPRHPFPVSRRMVGALATTVLLACTESPTATPILPNAAQASLSQPNATIGYSQEYSWLQGQTPTFLGNVASTVCFLTAVSGNLDGPSEWVGIIASHGMWYLRGSSWQSGVSAKARCLSPSNYGGEISLASRGGLSLRYLGGKACGLTRIGGKFDSYIDQVRIDEANGAWPRLLHVQAGFGGYVTARVRCIPDFYAPRTVARPVPWFSPAAPKQLAVPVSAFCFLTGMGGPFEGGADWVWSIKTTSAWYVMGNRTNPNLQAHTSCIW
jgi:hypothetical protein